MAKKTSAAATATAADGNPSKLRHIEALTKGVDSLGDDCLLEILPFLSREELNPFAICSRRCLKTHVAIHRWIRR